MTIPAIQVIHCSMWNWEKLSGEGCKNIKLFLGQFWKESKWSQLSEKYIKGIILYLLWGKTSFLL